VFHHGFTDHATEEPVKMVRGKVGDASEGIEFNCLVEVLLNVNEHAKDAFLVSLLGVLSHWRLRYIGY
jgi:hypothetical protein